MTAFGLLCALIVTLLVKNSFSEANPTIVYITDTQTKDLGATAELVCTVQDAQEGQEVIWTKMVGNIYDFPISRGGQLIWQDQRFSLDVHPTISNIMYLLRIKDIREKDAGTYKCQIIINVLHKVTANVELHVRIPPFINASSSNSIMVASETDDVTLECYAGGYPPPRVAWRREHNGILPTGGSTYKGNVLRLPNVRKEDHGTYTCVAENGVGNEAKRTITLRVQFSPVVSMEKPLVGQALGFDVDLHCHAEGYPRPSISWEKGKNVLRNSQQFKISNMIGEESIESTLRVVTIERWQYGIYICRAVNTIGVHSSDVELFESAEPVCPPACFSGSPNDAPTMSTGTTALLITLTICIFRSVQFQC